tara:strand:+ start:409 stop:900 length:492 start_codon:yes stop_codon:yes gene_type:complete
MPSKAKPIQMKTTYHVGGDTKAIPKPVDINAANARNKFNAANKSAVNARNTFNAANKSTPTADPTPTAVPTPTADTRKSPIGIMKEKSTPNRRRSPSRRLQQMQRRKLAMMRRRGGGRVSPAATPTPSRGGRPTPRNMAVRGPRRATGGRRRLGRNLSRFSFQ